MVRDGRLTRGNEFQMFWYDGPLNWVSELSIRSFTRFTGTTLYLYSYDRDSDPNISGCKWVNAEEIIPQNDLSEYRKNLSAAAASNIFRYKLLLKNGGWYFDTDCLLIKPLTPLFEQEYVFAREDADWVSTAVMKFPKNHPVIEQMYEDCVEFGPRKYRWPVLGRFSPKRYRWGMFGPQMFTKHLKRSGLIHKALPPQYFNPIHWTDVDVFCHPFVQSEQTFIVHLWNNVMRREKWQASDLDQSLLSLAASRDK